jgi:hypothetical protein
MLWQLQFHHPIVENFNDWVQAKPVGREFSIAAQKVVFIKPHCLPLYKMMSPGCFVVVQFGSGQCIHVVLCFNLTTTMLKLLVPLCCIQFPIMPLQVGVWEAWVPSEKIWGGFDGLMQTSLHHNVLHNLTDQELHLLT